jgi:hypothetical protein
VNDDAPTFIQQRSDVEINVCADCAVYIGHVSDRKLLSICQKQSQQSRRSIVNISTSAVDSVVLGINHFALAIAFAGVLFAAVDHGKGHKVLNAV